MKYLTIILAAFLSICKISSHAQDVKNIDAVAVITPYKIQVNDLKTTVVLFPSSIKSVDRGSRNVLAEKVSDVENALKIKADKPFQQESNLTVITADGSLYSFIVIYSATLPFQALDLRRQQAHELSKVNFENLQANMPVIKSNSTKILQRKPFLNDKVKYERMEMKLTGIYSSKGMMYYQVEIKNKSHLDYGIEFCHFFVRDRKKVKRMAVQEKEQEAVYSNVDSLQSIPGKSTRELVFAFNQFTISDNKLLIIDLYEKNGDRKLSLGIDGKELLKARPYREEAD